MDQGNPGGTARGWPCRANSASRGDFEPPEVVRNFAGLPFSAPGQSEDGDQGWSPSSHPSRPTWKPRMELPSRNVITSRSYFGVLPQTLYWANCPGAHPKQEQRHGPSNGRSSPLLCGFNSRPLSTGTTMQQTTSLMFAGSASSWILAIFRLPMLHPLAPSPRRRSPQDRPASPSNRLSCFRATAPALPPTAGTH